MNTQHKFIALVCCYLIFLGGTTAFAHTKLNDETQPKEARAKKKKANRPNIVFIMADDLGTRDLGCYGSDYYLTPNLDAFAEESLKFNKAYTASHVCSPTRASMLTGSYPHRIRITDALPWDRLSDNPKLVPPNHVKELPSSLPNFAKSLKSVGYKTALVGKWHLGNEYNFYSKEGHKAYGFDEAFHVSEKEKKRDKGVDELTEYSLNFLEANKDQPFLLYLTHHTPHVPLASTPEDKAIYDGVPKGRHQKNQTYAGMISHLDNAMQVILDKIEELKLDKNTIVIFTSDNGGLRNITSNRPFRGNKGDVYEGGVRVPLLIRWPGHTKAGDTFDKPVFSTDYFPTFLEMVGLDLDPKAHPDGKSMLAIWNGESKAYEPRTYFWHFPHRKNPASSVMQNDWKLVHNIKKDKYELFDLTKDPYERENLSSKYPKETKRLQALLEQHLQDLDAQRMYPNPEWDSSKPEGKQRSYGTFERPAGGVYQPVKTPYPTWFKKN